MIAAIRKLGGTPKYTEYCSNGLSCYAHYSWDPAYAGPDLLPWLFGAAAPPTSSNAAPTVSITSPANQATFATGTSITIRADATNTDGSIAKVAFY